MTQSSEPDAKTNGKNDDATDEGKKQDHPGLLDKLQPYLPCPPAVFMGLIAGVTGTWLLGPIKFMIAFVAISLLTPFIYEKMMTRIGLEVKQYVEKVDRTIVGVDMHIGEVNLCLCYGRITIKDFRIDNPDGFKSDYLLHCRELVVDLDMQELILTKGKHIIVEEMILNEVDAIVEYTGYFFGSTFGGSSNLQKVLDFMGKDKPSSKTKDDDKEDGKKEDKQQTAAEKLKLKEEEEKKKKDDKVKKPDEKDEKPGRRITMGKFHVFDVGAKMATAIGGTRVAVGDIRYKNFSEEVGSNYMDDVFFCIINTVAKSILVNIAGKSFGNKMM